MKNYKKVLQVAEHVLLVALIAGAVGFYLGNQYGTKHIDVNTLKTTQTGSK